MGADHAAVHQAADFVIGDCQGLEYGAPSSRLRPLREPVEDRLPATEALGQIPPRRSRLRDPDHGVDEIPFSPDGRWATSAGYEGSYRFPLSIR